MSNRRSKNLGSVEIDCIVGVLDGWKGPLSWGLLIEAIELRTCSRYTRQALSGHERISKAFRHRKQVLSEVPVEKCGKLLSPELQALQERLARRENEISRLQSENQRLIEQFVIWLYNAHLHGLTPIDLNRPLPPTNRGQTKSNLRAISSAK